ncbi:MAG: triose-phosphate isomerase [Anaerolineales bacterium]
MDSEFHLTAPFFELGPKAYLYGRDLLELALCADRISAQYSVPIIMTPQYVDIPLLARETKHLFIFAQHMDPLRIGRGIGSVLPEAVKAAGATGTLLNHAEKPLPMDVLEETVRRADEVGLATMVCAGDIREIEAISRMRPNIIIAESPQDIGTGHRSTDLASIQRIDELVRAIDPRILVLHAAGISCGEDVYRVIAAGAQATGSTSGVMLAENPCSMLEEMIAAVRQAWDDTHPIT